MDRPDLPHDLPETLAADREELRRRSRAERVPSLWLWAGVVTGPAAFLVVRTASIILLSRGCGHVSGVAILGLSAPHVQTAAITVLAALVTVASGLLSWRIWRRTSLPQDEVSTGNMPRVPFWALGGALLSAFFLAAIMLTGGLAIALSTGCS
jgi:hypothetical protein